MYLIEDKKESIKIMVNIKCDPELLEVITDCRDNINNKFYKVVEGKRRGIANNATYASLGKNLCGVIITFPTDEFKDKGRFGVETRTRVNEEKKDVILEILREAGIPV